MRTQDIPRVRGIWVESIGSSPALSTVAGLNEIFQQAKAFSTTDLYLQVYREGRSWYQSCLAGQEFYQACFRSGFEPLEEAFALAAKHSIRLHAWLNTFNLGLNNSARFLIEAGGSSELLTDNRGTRIDAYSDSGSSSAGDIFVLDAPKLWLDPASPRVRSYVRDVVSELIGRYPQFSGIHFDFFRYPYLLPMQPSSRIGVGFEFGYGESSLAAFRQECGIETGFHKDHSGALRPINDECSLAWDRWRRGRLDGYLEDTREIIGEDRALSVACLTWSDRAYHTAFQNWRKWLSTGMVNQACLMTYTSDDELFSYLVTQACAFQNPTASVIAGIGSYLLRDGFQLQNQMQCAKLAGARGEVLFSFENLKKKGFSLDV